MRQGGGRRSSSAEFSCPLERPLQLPLLRSVSVGHRGRHAIDDREEGVFFGGSYLVPLCYDLTWGEGGGGGRGMTECNIR